jgi:hypothetical protein
VKNDRQYNDQTNGKKRWRMTDNTMTKLMGKKGEEWDNTMTKLMGKKGEEWQAIQWPN